MVSENRHTSVDLSLALNLATRSCVVTGAFCNKTALISSSVTGPAAEVDPALEDGVPEVDPVGVDTGLEDDCVPLGGMLLFEAGEFSSLI